MKRFITTLATATVVAALVVVSAATAATTQAHGTVSGQGVVSGTLSGAMFFDFEYPYEYWGGGQQVVIVGREYFVGTIEGLPDAGWLHLEYRIESRWTLVGDEVVLIPNGRCQHRIIASGDGLAGVTGAIYMKDRWGASGEVVTTYSGHLKLPDAEVETANSMARTANQNRALSSLTRSTCGG